MRAGVLTDRGLVANASLETGALREDANVDMNAAANFCTGLILRVLAPSAR